MICFWRVNRVPDPVLRGQPCRSWIKNVWCLSSLMDALNIINQTTPEIIATKSCTYSPFTNGYRKKLGEEWYNRQREEILWSSEENTFYSGPSNYWWITWKLHTYWLWYRRCCTGDYLSLSHRTKEKSKRGRKPKTIKRKSINSFCPYWAIEKKIGNERQESF